MISVVSATAYPVEVATEKNILEFKEKKVTSFKINWDANGGKIGTKKTVTTTVNKGAKVKLVTNPKRAGYTFQGWYTAKTGGTKITKNTIPKKKVTYYAQWKKILTSEEKKLVGTYGYTNLASGFLSAWSDGYNLYQQWNRGAGTISTVKFNPDGTYESYSLYISQDRLYICTGNWKISQKGRYILTNYGEEVRSSSGEKWYNNYPPNGDHGMPYSFTTQDGKQGIIIGATKFYEKVKN